MSWERDFVNSILPIYANIYLFDDPIMNIIDALNSPCGEGLAIYEFYELGAIIVPKSI
jgi:hypothetical protein